MPVYLNWKGPKWRETVDEFEREPNQTNKEFREYVISESFMIKEVLIPSSSGQGFKPSPGSELAAMRRTVQSVCQYCGKPITGLARKKYCSASHRAMAHKKRNERKK